jgi:hypothetical protein
METQNNKTRIISNYGPTQNTPLNVESNDKRKHYQKKRITTILKFPININ